ncbi:MAG TPA: hypothetical protein VGM67_19315 [Gemmatimonadaceae bacterium]
MLHTFNRRRAFAAVVILLSSLGAGCESASIASPGDPSRQTARAALHDDDPATCRNGYTEIGGHIYCNPI